MTDKEYFDQELAGLKADLEAKFDTEIARARCPELKAFDRGRTKTEQDRAFDAWFRKGALSPESVKVLTVTGSDPSFGYSAPAQLSADIYHALTLGDPLRPLAKLYQTDSNSLEVLKKSASGAVVLQSSEVGEILETTGLAYQKLTFTPATEVYLLKCSNIQLEDSAFDMNQEIAVELGDAFATYESAAEAAVLVANINDGTLNTYNHTHAGSTSVITGDNIINLTYAVTQPYLANARFIMNRTTAAYIRTLKDGSTGAYLWQSLLTGGDRDRLCGFPVVICDNFPAMTSALYPIAFGDFSKGFAICDRFPQFQLQRLNERWAEYGITGFLARHRTISGPLDGKAIHWLQMSA